jgi:Carboxypeptidase regulatory-like domain/TonB dependent receptor
MKISESASLFVFLTVAFLVIPHSVVADVGGKITGVVKGPNGDAIPGATVVVGNTATGLKQTTTTDEQGVYSFPVLAVGQYDIEISCAGFQSYRRTGLTINVKSALQEDVTLRLREQSESVTVTEAADQVHIETADTELGQTLVGERIAEVPLNGRSYTNLLAVQTGVTPVATSATSSTSSGGGFGAIAPSGGLDPGLFSVNGQRESANGFMVNGANVEESVAESAAIIPNLDSISEFRVLTSNFDAEYGNYSGGLVTVVTKSGSNSFHGSAFEFLRNTALDARGFFDPTRAPFIQNQFGGTLGGPIKRDKLFFFVDYQGTRNIQGIETGLLPVPSMTDRTGNLLDQASSLSGVVVGQYAANLLTQKLGYTVSPGEAFYTTGCTTTSGPNACVFPNAVIPQSAWSLPAQHLLQYIPQPNVGSNEFSQASLAQRLNDGKGSARVDADTRFGNLSAYYFIDNYNLNNPYPTAQGGANVPGFNALVNGQSQLVNLSDTKTFGTTLVNEFRLSYLRDFNNLGQQQGGVGTSLASQGFTVGSAGILPGNPATEGVESIVFNKINFGTNPFSLVQTDGNYQLQDNLSKVKGSHTLKFGGQYLLQTVKLLPDFTANGQFQFTGYATGSDFADFLLGLPNLYTQGFSPAFYERSRYAGLYAQDSWRITPNLTLNYGVRWEVIAPWTEEHNQTGTLIPGEQSVVFPTAPTGFVFPGDPEVPTTIAPTRYNNFSPRIGLAYSPAWHNSFLRKLTGGPGKSSVRAGYGRFFTAIEGQTLAFETGNAPYGLTYTSPEHPLFNNPLIGAMTGTQYPQEFPVNVPPYSVSAKNPDANVNWSAYFPINGIDAFSPGNKTPYSENYFLSFERQIANGTVLNASYIGSQGHHQLVLLAANPGNPALCVSLSQPNQVAAGTPTCGPFGENLVYTRSNGQVVNGTRQPFRNNFGTDVYFDGMGNSAYNSLQVSLKHSGGSLTILGSYTYGKSLDQSSNLGEQVYPYNYKLTRALSSFDIRHNFVASYRYDLPFAKLFHQSSRATRGWAISGITRFSSGLPVTLVNPNDTALVGSFNNGVNGNGFADLDVSSSALQLNHNPRNGQAYFNRSLFSLPALGSPGTASRRFFYGPGMENWDIALLKDTNLTESKVLEFRLETFNTFNHAQFFGPNSADGNINDSTFGQVLSAMPPRLMQLALKFQF